MLLSIIIVNYNVKYFLEQCLYSVQKATNGIDVEIIVMDNASTDGSREWLEPKFTTVQFHWLPENIGFGKANNEALKVASGDFVLFLNPDTLIAEDSLQLCLAEMQKHKDIGAMGVRMIDGSGRFLKESKRGLPTASAAFFKLSGLATIFPKSKSIAAYYAGHLGQQESNNVEILSGAFMMVSKKAIELTKGFDEDFFMYGEDVDLSYRIVKAGMRCRYFAGTTIIHFKGESTQKKSAGYHRHFYGAMKLFVKKHFPDKKFLSFSTSMLVSAGKIVGAAKSSKRHSENDIQPLRTSAVATQSIFDSCVHLLKHSTVPLTIIGRIEPAHDETNKALGRLENIEQVIKQHRIQQTVLCSASISVKTIISIAEKIGSKTQLLFWMEGANSIVGSNNKNKNGKFIATPVAPATDSANQ